MSIQEQVLERLSQCEHLMRTNVSVEGYEINIEDDKEDCDNPGFSKGWHYFFDILSNSVISFPGKEVVKEEGIFYIDVRLTEEIIAKFESPELIEQFLEKSEMKSRYFSNIVNFSPENKISKKLGL